MMELIQDCRQRVSRKTARSRARVLQLRRDREVKPLTAAIVGCGTIAETHVDAYRAVGGVRIAACVDVQPERAETFRARHAIASAHTDLQHILGVAPPDIVSICTWPGTHAAIACAAAEAGVRGILVEKPMCVDVAEADAMVAAAECAGAVLVVGHQHRFNPVVEAAKRIIHSGILGPPKIIHVCCQTALLNNGTHAIDAVLSMLGDPAVESVWGQSVVTGECTERGLPAEDSSLAQIQLAGGITVILQTGALAEERFSALVVGGEGQLKLRFDRLQVLPRGSATWRTEAVPPADGHERQIAELVNSLRGHGSPCVSDGLKGRRTHELLIAILASAATRQPLAVPLRDRGWSYCDLLEELRSTRRVVRTLST